MSKRNKSKYAILGMLSLKPMSGYDIKKNIERGVGNFWNESFSQIYPILKQLTVDGLATVSVEQQDGKPNRNVYSITDKGRDQLIEWLDEPIIGHYPMRIELLLKLFFAHNVEPSVMITHVEQFQTRLKKTHSEYVDVKKKIELKLHSNRQSLTYRFMTLQFGIYYCEACLKWCDETLQHLKTLKQTFD